MTHDKEIEKILRPEHLHAGLRLFEDEDFVVLNLRGETVALFTQAASREAILSEADNYLGIGR